MYVRRLLVLLSMLLLTAAPTFAQQASDPNLNILYPPPIYALSGSVNVVGTANAPGMTSYFLEFRPMIDASTEADASVPWQPATLPSRTPVVGGVLGTWDTTLAADGLYELRLTVFTSGNQMVSAIVRPLRIINNPPASAVTPTVPRPVYIVVTATPQTQIVVQPQPTTASQSPMAQANLDANVRAGDSTAFAPVGALLRGQTAPIIGRSTRSTWWLIQLPNGGQGWIAPSTVTVTGDTSGVPYVAPPELTATPMPVATATPVGAALPPPALSGPLPDAAITSVSIDIGNDFLFQQGFPFTIIVTVVNNSAVPLPSISVACNFTPINNYFSTTLNGLPPFGQTDVTIPATIHVPGFNTGQQIVTANCAVDVNNLVAESDESNNYKSLSRELES